MLYHLQSVADLFCLSSNQCKGIRMFFVNSFTSEPVFKHLYITFNPKNCVNFNCLETCLWKIKLLSKNSSSLLSWHMRHLQESSSVKVRWYDMCHPGWAQAFNSDTSVSSALFPAAATEEACTDKKVKRHPPEADG